MRSNEFSAELKASRARVEELRHRAAEGLAPENVTAAALEELQAALEELMVADEELRQQNDELLGAREALECEHRRYLDLFEAAPDGYLVTSSSGLIRNANVAVGRLLSIAPSFLVGKPLSLFVVKEQLTAFRSQLSRLSELGSNSTEEFELRIQRRGGEVIDVAVSIVAIPDATGKSIALRWLIRNVTERKRIEEEIRNRNFELERRVSERTAELEAANRLKDELLAREQRARTEAETANRCKDDFLATLSHELRAPLNAIVGWSHILKSKPRDENLVDRGIEVIERNAVAQTRMVSDILEMSRIVTGKLRIELKPVLLSRIVEEALESLQPMAYGRSIRLESTLDRSSRPVLGDAVRLQQVIWNLISNAIKFTGPGGRVEVRLEHHDETVLTITDTGDGINSDLLPHVFDRFRQGDSSRTRRTGGLGLGLSIVRHLVEMHGGRVNATSAGPGQGASFVVTLPWAERSSIPSEGLGSAAHQAAHRPLDGLWVVFAVDDEAEGREVLRASLRSAGALVTCAASYADAILLIREGRPLAATVNGKEERASVVYRSGLPDLLVADIAVQGEDGFDLIRQVRALPVEQGGAIAAIALTAGANDEDLRVLAEGFQAYLTKPVTPGELVTVALQVTGR